MSSSMSIDTAKEIAQRLETLVLKLNGSLKSDGTTNTVGLIEQLDSVLTRVNDEAIELMSEKAREEALLVHTRIQEMLVAQDQYFNDRIFELDAVLQNGSKELKKQLDTIQTRTREAINDDIGKIANGLSLKINKDTSDVLNRFDKFKEDLDAFKANAINNYLWQIITMTLGIGIGILVGLYL